MQNQNDDRDDDAPDSGPPPIFGGSDVKPAPQRDVRADILTAINASDAPLTLEEVQDEIKADGYVAEGPLRKELDGLVTSGAIEAVPLGDPLVVHYRRSKAAVDPSMLRAVCLALAAIPDDRVPGGMMSAHEIATALEQRSGGSFDVESLEPLLNMLVQRGLLVTDTVQRTMPSAPSDGEDGDVTPSAAPPAVAVTVYGFQLGVLHQLLAPGFDALIDPNAAAIKPADGATADGTSTPADAAGVAAAKAAAASVYATRIVDAEKNAKAAVARAADAEKRAAAAERSLETARKRLEDRGLHGLFDEATAQKADTVQDERGKPILYEKRVPITDALKAMFHADGKAIRREVDRQNGRVETAKAAAKLVEAEAKERIATLTQRQRDMDEADDAGHYLLVVPEAYKLFDPATRRTGVYEYATRRFVCWDDPADLPKGAQPTLPGLDATSTDGASPATEAKPPAKGKRGRKPKAGGGEADGADDSGDDVDGDATGPSAQTPPEPPKAPPGAPAPARPSLDSAVATQLERGDSTLLKILVVLQRPEGGGPSADDVKAALQRLAAAGNEKAKAALAKDEPAKKEPDAAEIEAKAAQDAKAAQAAATVPSTKVLKPLIAEIVREAGADGMVWRTADGQQAVDMTHAYAAKVGKSEAATAASTPFLIRGSVESMVKNRVLVEVNREDGSVRLVHIDHAPKPKAAEDAERKGGGKGKKKAA